MTKKDDLSATQAIALAAAFEHGKLVRHQGGYWTVPNCPLDGSGRFVEWWGTTTIDALVDRGRLKFTDYKESRGTRFPIVAEVQEERRPLNGTKTHPLSEHAIATLRDIAQKPIPRQSLNPGVVNRLMRENLVEQLQLPSPYKTHRGLHGKGTCAHLRLTDAGRVALRNTQLHGDD